MKMAGRFHIPLLSNTYGVFAVSSPALCGSILATIFPRSPNQSRICTAISAKSSPNLSGRASAKILFSESDRLTTAENRPPASFSSFG
jgi:hypothetical protein